jgi:hypothetical protein
MKRILPVLALSAALVLAACTPSAMTVEKGSTAAGLRKVGTSATSNEVQCSELAQSGYSYRLDCTWKGRTLSVITAYLSKSKATGTVFIPGDLGSGRFHDPSAVWEVRCSWAPVGDTWQLTSCDAPTR